MVQEPEYPGAGRQISRLLEIIELSQKARLLQRYLVQLLLIPQPQGDEKDSWLPL